jgi:hypothetical protein
MRSNLIPAFLMLAGGCGPTGDLVDAITDYSELYVRGFAVSDGGGQRRAIEITLVELEVPSSDAEEPEVWCSLPPVL